MADHVAATEGEEDDDKLDERRYCPYCGGAWGPSLAVENMPGWDVARCATCKATRTTWRGRGGYLRSS